MPGRNAYLERRLTDLAAITGRCASPMPSGQRSLKLTIQSTRTVLRPAGMHFFRQRPRKLSGSTMDCGT